VETDFPPQEIENFEQSGYKKRLFSTAGYAPPYSVSLTLRSLLVKTFLISLFAVFLSLSFATHDAEARRMGGSKSFGMQRTAPAKQSATPTTQPTQSTAAPAKPATTPTAAPAPKRSWMGPLAGLAAGLGLAALFSHFGMGGEMASFLMLALLAMGAFMLFRLFMRRNAPAPAMQYAGMPSAAMDRGAPAVFDATPSAAMSGGHAARSFPPGFDADAFAREAKLNFIRLQAAFDAGNLDDLRAFTSPEVFAEVRMQLAERGDAAQTTDVVSINAEVLEAVDEGNQHVVSVRFTGLVREAADQAAMPVDEIWHLTKPVSGQGGWVIAGIQQQ
jgi:predicted lipid-binding transport protein (Tim44 family)